jgi:hypothetical protein
MPQKLQVRVISPWFGELDTEEAFFSVNLPSEKADALLCDWAPSEELFTFPRRKAWYCCEPSCQFNSLGGGTWPTIRDRLAPHEFLWHNHPEERYRVPHVTHHGPLSINSNPDRIPRAIAIVSNHGGAPWRRHRDLALRSRLVTHPSVDLYGRSGWRHYRRHWYSRPGFPANYRGEIPGDWDEHGKRELMARYQVAICLENMSEPNYFTEKFVEAVCAGCVPVYRAHETVGENFLKGASWIDSANFDDRTDVTIKRALDELIEPMVSANVIWLASDTIKRTNHRAVFETIARILKETNP